MKKTIYLILGASLFLAAVNICILEATPKLEGPTFAELIRDQTRWPMRLKITHPYRVHIIDNKNYKGWVELNPGVSILATEIDENCVLRADWAGVRVLVPMDKTDMIKQLWGNGAYQLKI
jgi:hypothetical protein